MQCYDWFNFFKLCLIWGFKVRVRFFIILYVRVGLVMLVMFVILC